ncbi:E3 ubiquitin-protein ligase keg [Phtheirospermum japonicum]|uniref:E3 ubiquitin-protein ligase keg n=1 Tax=Phtheirospermum japonicum TaxID=374723 RepID=A0A830C6S8_9LAMI|nr:E3 ubiquitin-protein ligase keg [Phtheirospermum japonicum]
MTDQIKEFPTVSPFDYELYEGDPDKLKTVDATPTQPNSYINPSSLKLKYRIGHGHFGDVWLATHHQSGKDYDEYHEVAVKMIHHINEDHVNEFLRKFEELWVNLKSRKLQCVCWLHGISVISGKVSIALKSYEGSIGDRLAHVKGGKLPLQDPNNFLLDDHDHVVLGDFGVPHLLLGIPWRDPDLAFRLGTPNYMAPEQWQPGVRGPISHETDSWGLACSVIEMLTGSQPWFGQSVEEIYQAVVVRKEKPHVPNGLPPEVDDVLRGCFEYDFRNRPLMPDILHAFERSRNAVYTDGSSSGLAIIPYVDNSNCSGYNNNKWFLSKDHLQIGDAVRSRKAINTCKPPSLSITEGIVVGLEKDSEKDKFVLVQIPNMQNHLRLNAPSLERVTFGFTTGDWVRINKESREYSPLGILHYITRDGFVAVGFLGLETLWRGHCSEIQKVEPFFVGRFVRLKADITSPRFEWPRKRGGVWASGKIGCILPNGCLEVNFPGRLVFGDESNIFLADPEEVECVCFDTCRGVVEKYEFVEDFHWAVRPITVAFGLVTAVRFGTFLGKNVGKVLNKREKIEKRDDGGKSGWLRNQPNVANILFKEKAPRHFHETEHEEEEEEDDVDEEVEFRIKGKAMGDVDSISKQLTCMKLNKREPKKPHEDFFSCEKYGEWRQEQRSGAAKLKKQLKVRWAIQKLIDEQMGRFEAHYNRAMAPTKMSDVAQLLMPKWIPAHELTALYWLGGWRPSTILELLRSLAHSLWDPAGVERALAQLINDIRIEEAVIDEEMTEIQSNCVLYLPFGPVNNEGSGPALARVRSEFKKIHRVIVKAENLSEEGAEPDRCSRVPSCICRD